MRKKVYYYLFLGNKIHVSRLAKAVFSNVQKEIKDPR